LAWCGKILGFVCVYTVTTRRSSAKWAKKALKTGLIMEIFALAAVARPWQNRLIFG